jgi:hypothetical protein
MHGNKEEIKKKAEWVVGKDEVPEHTFSTGS